MDPRDVPITVLKEIGKNVAMSVPFIRKMRVKLGRTALPPEIDQLDRFVYKLLDYVQKYAGPVAGKSVLEIGPGDNLVTGLAFLAAGAASYTALDRFPGPYASADARQWYKLLAQHWRDGSWPEQLDPLTFPYQDRVNIKPMPIENAGVLGHFDIVCSMAVGEHITDIGTFARAIRDAIRPGGIGVHYIDFSGHQWDQLGDPFLFLKFPELLWKMMGSQRGAPNRVRFDQYKECFEDSGLIVEVPERRLIEYDPADEWVRLRADASFLTSDAVFVLR